MLLLFHIFIAGPSLLYISLNKDKISLDFYNLLYYLSIALLIYHGYRAMDKLKLKSTPWVNYIHIFIIAPLLFYIGKNKTNTEYYYFEILKILGFGIIGHNAYTIFNL